MFSRPLCRLTKAPTLLLPVTQAVLWLSMIPGQTARANGGAAGTPVWDKVVSQVITEVLAPGYVDEKKWGRQKNLTVGVKLHRDGLTYKAVRRRKLVNHGDWRRYEINLDRANPRPLKLVTLAVRQGKETKSGKGMELDLRIDLPLKLKARLAQWRRGIQLYSVEAEGTADVRVDLTCKFEATIDTDSFPPALVFKPEVTRAEARLRTFELQRISDIHGPAVKQLGKALQDVANQQLEKRRADLVKKINRQLKKKSDRFRLGPKKVAENQQDASDNPRKENR